MDIEKNSLNLPPTAEKLRRLARDGILNEKALERGLKIINPAPT